MKKEAPIVNINANPVDSTHYEYDNNVNMRLKLLVISTLMVLLVLSGCALSEGDRYRKFTLKEGNVYFSFQYSENYEISYELLTNYLHVTLILPASEDDWRESWIKIYVIKAGYLTGSTNSVEWIGENIKRFRLNKDFEIEESSSIDITGLSGEYIKCSWTDDPDRYPFGEGPLETETYVNESVYFDCGGYVWSIRMISEGRKLAEAAEADFKHLLETFKILWVKEK